MNLATHLVTPACLVRGRQRSRSGASNGITATKVLIALNVIVYAFQTRYPGITKAGWKVQYAVLAFVDATLLGYVAQLEVLIWTGETSLLKRFRRRFESYTFRTWRTRTPVACAERELDH